MPVSMNDLRTTFGAAGTVSLSQFYRGGTLVPNVSTNSAIATGSAGTSISLGSFTSRTNLVPVSYDVLGGGGGGGFGNQEDEGSSHSGETQASAGGSSSLSGSGFTTVTSTGGAAGASRSISGGSPYRYGTAGESSAYGTGGTRGVVQEDSVEGGAGAGAPSYAGGNGGIGAGGGGAGGDLASTYDTGGWAGEGGSAGQRKTGTVYAVYKSTMTLACGAGGAKGNGPWASDGGNGGAGRVSVTRQYLSGNLTTTRTTSGSQTLTV